VYGCIECIPCTVENYNDVIDLYPAHLFTEAEHGYASMLPFTSSKEKDSLKRKNKSKKNSNSR
jgi:hypothetical protein